jgi:hypothetical protein
MSFWQGEKSCHICGHRERGLTQIVLVLAEDQMKAILPTAIALACLAVPGQVRSETKHVILPNPKLVRCVSLACSQLWLDKAPEANDIYPQAVTVELPDNTPCALAVTAQYDKSVSFDDLKAAIDARYGKWAGVTNDTSPVKSWRVESERFTIRLRNITEQDAKLSDNKFEVGTKMVVYTSFQPTKCDSE